MSIDVQSLLDLDGRVAIVTGASSGFGDRFARVLHAAGASVMAAAPAAPTGSPRWRHRSTTTLGSAPSRAT